MHLFIASFGSTLLACALMATVVVADDATQAKLANPASVNCQQQGGELSIRHRPDSGEYGVCVFEDNRQCEEWALRRGDCPSGGLKITGYDTDAEIYCAITGGAVNMAEKTCTTPNGTICDGHAYFQGTCPSASDR